MAGSETIRELLVRLGVKTDTEKLAKFDKGLEQVKAGMKRAAIAAAGLSAAVGGATFALLHTVQAAANVGDEASKTAKIVGLSTEAWSEYAFAARRANVNAEVLRISLSTQARTAQDVVNGSKEMGKYYKMLGLEGKTLKDLTKDQDALFQAVLEGLGNIKDEGARLNIAQRIFGEGGARLMPLIKDGPEGFKKLRQQARDYGLVISGPLGKQSERFNDALANAKESVLGLKTSLGLALMPVLTELLDGFQAWFVANRAWMQLRIEKAAKAIGDGFKWVAKVFTEVDKIVQRFGGWSTVLVPLTLLASGLGAAFSALWVGGPVMMGLMAIFDALVVVGGLLGGGFLAGVGGVVAAIGGLLLYLGMATAAFLSWYLILEDVYYWMTDGESAIGAFIDRFIESDSVLGGFAAHLVRAKDFMLALFDAAKPVANVIGILLNAAIEQYIENVMWLGSLLKPVFGLLIWAVDKALIPFKIQMEIIGTIIETLSNALKGFTPLLNEAFGTAKDMGDVMKGLGIFGEGVVSTITGNFAPTAAPSNMSTTTNTTNNTITAPASFTVNGVNDPTEFSRQAASQWNSNLNNALPGGYES